MTNYGYMHITVILSRGQLGAVHHSRKTRAS